MTTILERLHISLLLATRGQLLECVKLEIRMQRQAESEIEGRETVGKLCVDERAFNPVCFSLKDSYSFRPLKERGTGSTGYNIH